MKGYLDAKELESYKKEDLQELAKQLGVDAEGTKKEIAARCAAVEVDIPDNSELTEEDKKVAAEAAAEAAAKAEEEKKRQSTAGAARSRSPADFRPAAGRTGRCCPHRQSCRRGFRHQR